MKNTRALIALCAAFAAVLPRCGFAAPTTVTARVATNIAEHVTARDAFTAKTDRDGNRTALTVGTRRDGSAVGRGSATVGERNEASWQGAFAQGHGSVAGAEHSVAMGHAADATNVDSFVWNGDSDARHGSRGRGTFSINPLGGANGFYIAGTNVTDVIRFERSGAARPLPKYLHAIRFSDSYPEEARMYYDWVYGKCSSMRDGGFHSRNYDWDFDESCVFVTLMESGRGRRASVGISGVGTNLTEETVVSGKWSKWYKALPGHTLDGINDAGVAANVNVVSSHGHTNGWHALSSDTNAIHALAAVRWVLDNADSAEFAATSLAERVWVPQKMLAAGYSVHYMISDARETWVAEEGGARLVSRGGRVAMTNFRLFDKMDGKIDRYGTGYERYDVLMQGQGITNAWFTKAYEYGTYPRRYSEFVAPDVYNVTSAWNAAAAAWAAKPKESHRGEPLPGGDHWWQSVHTSVYDLTNRTLRVAVQETDDWYAFGLPGGGGGADPDKVREIIARTDVRDYPEPEGDSVLERVTNADVGLVVTNGILMVVDKTNVVWESESASVTNQFGQVKEAFRQFTNEFNRVETKMLVYNDFLGGSNVVFEITNYLSGAYSTDATKLAIKEMREVAPGVTNYVPVYESRTDITNHLGRFRLDVIDNPTNGVAASINAVSNGVNVVSNYLEKIKADKAWGKYASDGAAAPSNTVVIRARSTVFAGGYAFDRANVGSGTVAVLANRGAAAYTGEPGTFRFRDAISGEYFGYVKNNYTLGVNTDGIDHVAVTNASGAVVSYLVKLTYDVTMSGYPIVKYMESLDDYNPDEWEQLNYATGDPVPGASHLVTWEDPDPMPGRKVCWINVGMEPKGFFTAVVGGIAGQSVFDTNMTIDPKGGFVAVDSVNTNATYTIEPYVDVGVVKWRVRN